MTGHLARIIASCIILYGSWPTMARAQTAAPAATAAADHFNTEQIDALVAPIALYPDALVTQVLMASTYPLQVVEAARWVENPANKSLSGTALETALEPLPWDPSVKSLVPFPTVLTMMNGNLDWMQQLGYAFADQQAAVLDSVQRLRRQAQAAGALTSSPEQVVRTEQQIIYIEPAQPNVIYVPNYNPTVVYGAWPYPAYPPVYVSPYPIGTALAAGLAFGAGIAIAGGLWGWARPVWGSGGYVNVNVNRYNNINVNNIRNNRATAINSGNWQPNRSGGRPAGMPRPPGGPVGAPARPVGLPANAVGRPNVSVPGNAVNPPRRGPAGPGQGAAPNRPGTGQPGGQPGVGNRPGAGQQPGGQPNRGNVPAPANRPAAQPSRSQGAFSGMNDGRQASQFGQRGGQSRASNPAPQRQAPQRPAGGGGGGGARGGARR